MTGIYLGTEYLTCPRCKRRVALEVMHNLPAEDWLECPACNYRAIIDARPILDKYGLPYGCSAPEKSDMARYLPGQTAKIAKKELV